MYQLKSSNEEQSTNHSEIAKTIQCLNEGCGKIKLSKEYKNVTLVLGNTGSGKSTLVQWIAGNDNDVFSKETEPDSGVFTIEDSQKRIGSSIYSITCFPELVINAKPHAAYYDCPGFSDTRSTANDIANNYNIKQVIDHSNGLKIVLVVNYASVCEGADRSDFVTLLRHATNLIKNAEKYQNSLALIVTKVNNISVKKGNCHLPVSDEKIITTIAGHLKNVEKALREKSKDKGVLIEEEMFLKQASKMLGIFLTVKNENLKRIAIFRRPDEPGSLSNIEILKEGKYRIETMLHEELQYAEKGNHDFGYAISDASKNAVHVLSEIINDEVWADLAELLEKVKKHYEIIFSKMKLKVDSFLQNAEMVTADEDDAHKFQILIKSSEQEISLLVAKSKKLKMSDLSYAMQKTIINSLGVKACKASAEKMSVQVKYFEFLECLSCKEVKTRPWSVLFQQLETDFLAASHHFYKYANESLWKIYDSNKNHITNIGKSICEFYKKQTSSTEIITMLEKLNEGSLMVSNWIHEKHLEKMSEVMRKSVPGNLYSSIGENAIRFSQNVHYFKFLSVFYPSEIEDTSQWIQPLQDAQRYLADLAEFMLFLHELNNKFSEYNVQQNKMKYNVAYLSDWGYDGKPQGIHIDENNFQQFMEKTELSGIKGFYTVKKLKATGFHFKLLNRVLEKTLKSQWYPVSQEPGKLLICGDFIKFSDFIEPCGNKLINLCNVAARRLDIFALRTVFIDTDMLENGLHLNIIAPKFEIIGNREINLDGVPGRAHFFSKAYDGKYPGDNGKNGLAGLPGGPGGSFFGICLEFVKGENLTISVRGGQGGPGQDGGNGVKGEDGLPATKQSLDKTLKYSKMSFNAAVWNQYDDKIVFHGELGGDGGNGGDGGVAGHGGVGGKIKVFQLASKAGFPVMRKENGLMGADGKGGKGAESGKFGKDLNTTKHRQYVLWFLPYQNWWGEDEMVESTVNAKNIFGLDGIPGDSDYKGRQQPQNGKESESSDVLRNYKMYLNQNLYDNFNKINLQEFLKKLVSNARINSMVPKGVLRCQSETRSQSCTNNFQF